MTAVPTTVLHVEDDPNDALLFQHACRKAAAGFDLRAVTDGDEAIAYLLAAEEARDVQKYPLPQLVLLDLKLPRLNGFEVLSWVRAEARLKGLPIIVLTSSSHEIDVKRAYDLGANSYLVKPVGFDALVEVVRTIQGFWLNFNQPPVTW